MIESAILKAARIVASMSGDAKIKLFCHFDDHFGLCERGVIDNFARSCGFYMAVDARVVPYN